MPLVLGTVEPRPITELSAVDRGELYSDAPWLVITHEEPKTVEEAIAIQEEIACKLELAQKVDSYDRPFRTGTYWHNDGDWLKPMVNEHTTYGTAGGVLYLAHALIELDMSPTVTKSEQHIIDLIEPLQKVGKIGELVVRIPFSPGISTLWREVAPTPDMSDVAHAVFAEPTRTTAVSEYLLGASNYKQ